MLVFKVFLRCTIPVLEERIVNDSYVEILSGYSETSPFPVLEDHILQINRFCFF